MQKESIIAEIRREIAQRRNVYPRLIAERKLSQLTGDKRISSLDDAILLLNGQSLGRGKHRRDDAVAELNRELHMRKVLFPKWIAQGTLTKEDAKHRIDCFQAAIDHICGKQEYIFKNE